MESRAPSQPATRRITGGMHSRGAQSHSVIGCSELIELSVDKILNMDEVSAPVTPFGVFRRDSRARIAH